MSSDWRPELSKLILELIEIGKNEGFYNTKPVGSDWTRYKHKRAREIGVIISKLENKFGYENLELMKHAHAAICQEFDTAVGSELSGAWDAVGRWQD